MTLWWHIELPSCYCRNLILTNKYAFFVDRPKPKPVAEPIKESESSPKEEKAKTDEDNDDSKKESESSRTSSEGSTEQETVHATGNDNEDNEQKFIFNMTAEEARKFFGITAGLLTVILFAVSYQRYNMLRI